MAAYRTILISQKADKGKTALDSIMYTSKFKFKCELLEIS